MDTINNRHLAWAGSYNIRDIGGYPTSTNGETKWGVFIRADNLSRLQPVGQAALIDYGVRTIIDVRSPDEFIHEPYPFSNQNQQSNTPTYLNLPLEDRENPIIQMINQAEPMAQKYSLMLTHFQTNIAAIIQAISQAQAGGILVHCQVGKDRTGLITALLLALVGVSEAIIVADYALSEQYLMPLYDHLVAEAGSDPIKREQLPPPPIALPETMNTVLTFLNDQFGGVTTYLKGAGLTDDELFHIRCRLVTPQA